MFHDKRTWCIHSVDSPEELARTLTEYTMCCCNAFELAGYLFLNDSTSPDGAQEYAVLKKADAPDAPCLQIESITFGWCDYEKGLQYVRDILSGHYDESQFVRAVQPRLESPAEHGRCGHCA